MALGRRHFLLYVMSGRYADKYRFETTPEELDYLFSGTRRKLVVEDAFSELRATSPPSTPPCGGGGSWRRACATRRGRRRCASGSWCERARRRAGRRPAPSPRARPDCVAVA